MYTSINMGQIVKGVSVYILQGGYLSGDSELVCLSMQVGCKYTL